MHQDGHHLDKSHHKFNSTVNRSNRSVYLVHKSTFTIHQMQNKPQCSRYNNCYLFPLSVSSIELLSFGLALNHWIHCLQVGGVRHERQRDVLVRFAVDPLVVHPKVVFDIP